MIYRAFWLKIVSVICYTTEILFRITYNTWCCEELKSPLFVKCLNWWSIIYIDVYLHFSGRAGYITKQPLLINLMDMFAAIIASTNILLFFISVCRFSRISFLLSLRTSVSSCQLAHPRSKNNLLLQKN